eukprot:Filipodium_phascolosomae@DN5534_c0_g1_i1.p1
MLGRLRVSCDACSTFSKENDTPAKTQLEESPSVTDIAYEISKQLVWKGVYYDLVGHKKVCKHVVIGCPHMGCSMHSMRKDIEIHEAACPYRPVRCPICLEELEAYDLAAHRATCAETLLDCSKCGKPIPWRT